MRIEDQQSGDPASKAEGRSEHKHEAIRNSLETLDASIGRLESLLSDIQQVPSNVAALDDRAESTHAFSSLSEALAILPENIDTKSERVRSAVESIRKLLF